MRLGAENKTKLWLMVGLAAVALYLAITRLPGGFSTPPQTAAVTKGTGPNIPAVQPTRRPVGRRGRTTASLLTSTLDPRLRLDLLKRSETVEYKGAGRNIFRAEEAPAPIPQPVKPPLTAGNNGNPAPPPVVVPPPPPPIPLKFFGIASKPGEPKRALLADGEDVFVAKEGDIVDRHYKINKIGVNSVEIQDVLTNNVQTIPLTAQG